MTYIVMRRRSEGQRVSGKSHCPFEVVLPVVIVHGEYKPLQKLFTAQSKDFQKAFNKLPLKRLLINIFKNVPQRGVKSEKTNLLTVLNYSGQWKLTDAVKLYRKMA